MSLCNKSFLSVQINPKSSATNLTRVFQYSSSLVMASDRKAVATHLPLAASRSTPQEEERLLAALEEFALKFKP